MNFYGRQALCLMVQAETVPPCQLFSQYGTYYDDDDNADDDDDFGHRLMMMMVVMDYTGLIRFDNDQNFEGLRVTLIDLYDQDELHEPIDFCVSCTLVVS